MLVLVLVRACLHLLSSADAPGVTGFYQGRREREREACCGEVRWFCFKGFRAEGLGMVGWKVCLANGIGWGDCDVRGKDEIARNTEYAG